MILFFALPFLMGIETRAKDSYETIIQETSYSSASKVVLDRESIRKSKAPNLSALLATQANISIPNSSFQPGSLFLRGGDSSHVLIVVDGLPSYDVSTTQRTFNLNELDINTVRRIEIIKGSQSVLYGGQALAGVILIETMPTEIEKSTVDIFEVGMRDSQKISLLRDVPLDDNSALLARLQGATKANRSPVLESPETYREKLWTGDMGFVHRGSWDYFFKASQISNPAEIPASQVSFSPDSTVTSTYEAVDAKDFKTKSGALNFTAGADWKQSPFRPKLIAGYQQSSRTFSQPTTGTDEKYDGELFNARVETSLKFEKHHILTGASFLKEKWIYRVAGQELANDFLEQTGAFSKVSLALTDPLWLEAGARADFYRNQKIESYQVGLSLWGESKLEFSTGFKNPSLFQLFGGASANPDLKPERSQSLSLSFDRSWGQSQFFSVALFESTYQDLIAARAAGGRSRYENVSRAKTRGMEAQYSAEFENLLKLDVALGYQEPRDLDADRWLLRRPLQTASLRLSQGFSKSQIGYEILANGERLDLFYSNFTTGESHIRSLPPFMVSNLFVTHDFTNGFSAYFRGNNIWNSRYEHSRGYHDEGAFWLLGMEFSH